MIIDNETFNYIMHNDSPSCVTAKQLLSIESPDFITVTFLEETIKEVEKEMYLFYHGEF